MIQSGSWLVSGIRDQRKIPTKETIIIIIIFIITDLSSRVDYLPETGGAALKERGGAGVSETGLHVCVSVHEEGV